MIVEFSFPTCWCYLRRIFSSLKKQCFERMKTNIVTKTNRGNHHISFISDQWLYYWDLEIADIDECYHILCQNNATCRDLVNAYQCDCVPGFNGTHCENSKYCQCGICFRSGTTCTNWIEISSFSLFILFVRCLRSVSWCTLFLSVDIQKQVLMFPQVLPQYVMVLLTIIEVAKVIWNARGPNLKDIFFPWNNK